MTSFDLQTAGLLGLGGPEVLIIVVVAVVLFAGKRSRRWQKGLAKESVTSSRR